MTNRSARAPARPLSRRPKLQVTGFGVSGHFRPVCGRAVTHVVALVDGVMQAAGPVIPAGDGTELWFELGLPPHLLGGTLDIVAAETGASVLDSAVDLAGFRGLRWYGWHLCGQGVSGGFSLHGPAAPAAAAIPVELRAGTDCFGTGYAVLETGSGPVPAYRFRVAFNRLPPLSEGVTIIPVAGGIAVPEPLCVPAAAFGFAGYADPAGRSGVAGWVVDLTDPGRRVEVEVRVNGRPVAKAVGDRMRPDVQRLGLGDGRSGFLIPLPAEFRHAGDVEVAVLVAGTALHLCNSPYTPPADPPVTGFLDRVEGSFVTGWAVNMLDPEAKLLVEAVCDGQVIGSGVAESYRADVAEAGLPTARCGFQFRLEPKLPYLLGRDISVRVGGTGDVLPGSPCRIVQNPNISRFLARSAAIRPAALQRLARRMAWQTRLTGISIIMPVFDTPAPWLRQALASVLGQWSGNWELICVDDASQASHVRGLLSVFARRDARIRVLRTPAKLGLARSINLGLRAARGTYVAFMDPADTIEPDATHKLALAAQRTGADLIYGDEAVTGTDIDTVLDVHARPAFSHDFYLSHPTGLDPLCVRAALAHELAGWDESLDAAARPDFVLRTIERAQHVAHVPSVLYRCRSHAGRGNATNGATKAALSRHLVRLGTGATVADGLGQGQYRIDWPDDGGEVLIVIPTKDGADLLAPCIEAIERTAPGENCRIVVIDHASTDPNALRALRRLARRHTVMRYAGPFNYARMNNEAVRAHAGAARYVLLLNNDVEAREPGWIPRLRSLAARKEVGAVGPLLLYDNDLVQHAGVIVGFAGAAEHAMKQASAYRHGAREPGYCCNLTSVRDYSAVTAACMMVRREAWDHAGGFDEAFEVGFNDTDFCLRLRQAGYKVLYDGHTVLTHRESVTRSASQAMQHPADDARLRARWGELFAEGDPFYSPLLSHAGTNHVLRSDTGCKRRPVARAVPGLGRQDAARSGARR